MNVAMYTNNTGKIVIELIDVDPVKDKEKIKELVELLKNLL